MEYRGDGNRIDKRPIERWDRQSLFQQQLEKQKRGEYTPGMCYRLRGLSRLYSGPGLVRKSKGMGDRRPQRF